MGGYKGFDRCVHCDTNCCRQSARPSKIGIYFPWHESSSVHPSILSRSNERHGVSNDQWLDCCLSSLFTSQSKKTWKSCVTEPLGTNLNEIIIAIQTFSFKEMHLKMSPAKWRPFCPRLNLVIWRISRIITLIRHKKARFDSKTHGSTQKSPVRHKNARFDTKMPSPAFTSGHCHYQTLSHPFCEKYFFSNFIPIFCC